MSTAVAKFYKVSPEEDVKLTLEIGYNQRAFVTIDLDDRNLIQGEEMTKEKPVLEQNLGKGRELDKKQLFCTILVKDVNPDTDQSRVKYTLQGGPREFHKEISETVSSPGGIVYTAHFLLFA